MCNSLTLEALKIASPFLLSSVWRWGIRWSSALYLCRENNKLAPLDPDLLAPLGRLFRSVLLCFTGHGNHVAHGLLRLCTQAFGSAALVGLHARASAVTPSLFLPSSLGLVL
jgi:hypothetical protein